MAVHLRVYEKESLRQHGLARVTSNYNFSNLSEKGYQRLARSILFEIGVT